MISWSPPIMVNWRKQWTLGILVLCLGGLSLPLLVDVSWFGTTTAPAEQGQSLEEISRQITVKILAQDFLGSGIILRKQGSVYQVITNNHVIDAGNPPYKIQTPDGKIHHATVKLDQADFAGDDLAVLEFTSTVDYAIAQLTETIKPQDRVFASGFPFSPNQSADSAKFILKTGQIVEVLAKPLEGGYQVGYTNDIEKGMSGGPVINEKGQVVAVNGMHAEPLWGDPYIYKDGSSPTRAEAEQMSHYSWGIPIFRLKSK